MQEALGCNSWWFHCCIASLLPNADVWCCGLLPFAQDFFLEGTSSCSGLISPCKSLALYWPQEPSSKVKVTVLSVSLQRHRAVTSPPRATLFGTPHGSRVYTPVSQILPTPLSTMLSLQELYLPFLQDSATILFQLVYSSTELCFRK